MGQAKYVCSVHRFIQDLTLLIAPELAEGSRYVSTNTAFSGQIDRAISEVTSADATGGDYIRAIVDAACREMAPLCGLLRSAAAFAGLGKIAADYLDARRFRKMLLRKDSEKLERLIAILQKKDGRPVKILMDIAAELDGRTANYDGMDATAKRKATAELRKVIANVSDMVTETEAHLMARIDAKAGEIGGKVEAVERKVDRLRLKRTRKSRYTEAQRKVCGMVWKDALANIEVRHSVNTRPPYKAAFGHYSQKLAEVGVTSVKMFRAVMHSIQNMKCAAGIKALDAKRDGRN